MMGDVNNPQKTPGLYLLAANEIFNLIKKVNLFIFRKNIRI
jgi:hypothetical protein